MKTEKITLADVKRHPQVETFLQQGNDNLGSIGFTEHGARHATLVATIARQIMQRLGYSERECELAAIAGYLHDIGNVISREGHGLTGAMIAMQLFAEMGMPYDETAIVAAAIGNHEEQYGVAVHPVAAALILADKSDVHRSRVRNPDVSTFDIHDRVNLRCHAFVLARGRRNASDHPELTIDQSVSSIFDYFEIFLLRMVMCRRAAETLQATFSIVINDSKLL